MVDTEFNSWLIEINSSPAMDYSTPITERLVKQVLPDTIKVVIDYNNASFKRKKKVDTGLWRLIYKGKNTVIDLSTKQKLLVSGSKCKPYVERHKKPKSIKKPKTKSNKKIKETSPERKENFENLISIT